MTSPGPQGIASSAVQSGVLRTSSGPHVLLSGSSLDSNQSVWKNLSPFSQHDLLQLEPFSFNQIQNLLVQYREQEQASLGQCSIEDVPALARIIYARTSGFPGLTGLCCSEIVSKSISTPQEWAQWCGPSLVKRVLQQRNYSIIASLMHSLTASVKWRALREVLADLLLFGSATIRRSLRKTVGEVPLAPCRDRWALILTVQAT